MAVAQQLYLVHQHQRHRSKMMSSNTPDSTRMSATQGSSEEESAKFEEAKAAGNAAFRERRYAEAITNYTKAESINPCVAVIPANRAMAHLKLENWDAANADATVALALQDEFAIEPGHFSLRVKCYLRRARARKELGRVGLAAEDYRSVLEIEENNNDAKNGLKNLGQLNEMISEDVPKITVVDDVMKEEGKTDVLNRDSNVVRQTRRRGDTNGLVRDFPLLRIGGDGSGGSALSELTRKWICTPPRNVMEFERAWRSTRGQDVARAKYLLLIGANRIRRGLFGHSMTSQLLCEIITSLRAYHGEGAIVEVFHAVCGVQRIGIAVMLLPEDDRRHAIEMCEEWKRKELDTKRIEEILRVING